MVVAPPSSTKQQSVATRKEVLRTSSKTRRSMAPHLLRPFRRVSRDGHVKVKPVKARSLSLAIHRRSIEQFFFPNRKRPVVVRAQSAYPSPSKRISLFLGSINRKEKIIQRFILHMQLGVLMRQTTHMHSITKGGGGGGGIQARDLETRIGDWTLDKLYRQKNLYICINALMGLALAMWELQFSWSHSTVGPDSDWSATNGGSVRALGITSFSTILKLIISLSTVVLLIQVVDLYRLYVKENHAIWGDSAEFGPGPTWTASLLTSLAIEIVVLMVHPVPFLEEMVHQAASCLMFGRLYLLARVYRDHAAIFRLRKEIVQHRFLHSSSPVFNWALPLKVAFEQSPLRLLVVLFFAALPVFSISIYVLERQYQPDIFTFANSTWFAYSQLNIHKVSFHARTWKGRVATASMVALGTLFETMLVVAILHKIGLRDKDRLMLAYIQRNEATHAVQHAARKAIRNWMRWKVAVRQLHKADRDGGGGLRRPSALQPPALLWSSKPFAVVPVADGRCRKHEASFWNAIEKFRQARSGQQLVEQAVNNPVLDKLHALEEAVIKIRAKLSQPTCSICGGAQRPGSVAPKQTHVVATAADDEACMMAELEGLKRTVSALEKQRAVIQSLLSCVA
ncbi:hypothetical protein, variant [Aphanomyces invadans]|uniref:Uncharacterized protein n=1 Tax=Aphanomyces invadans TaxID=157072 RepID=A0A024U1M3_9STRA|nr:hypothetical protein, variant [Aphanomyces invadans]ETV99492.1 hypothetical protein, variant [Aphanomyces invadans]|eukprot:XP_008872048.1 hypothetical protein, variant [Aphanomyces invadans]